MSSLSGWTRGEHTADVRGRPTTHPTYRRGTGPGVIVIHEIPGLTDAVVAFADEVVEAGHTVVLPHLFGPVGVPEKRSHMLTATRQVCVSREFTKLATGVTTPVAGWLRHWPATCTQSSAVPAWGRWGCTSPAASPWP